MSEIKEILSKNKTIAMIGVSKDLSKPSTIVMKYMQKYGYKVIPVNPSAKGEKILGEKVFEKLEDIKTQVDIVDVFRPSVEAFKYAEDTAKIGAKVLWLQLGIRSPEAKKILGEEVFGKLDEIKTQVDIVDVFRPSKEAVEIAKDTVKIGAKVLWLQLGISSNEAKTIVETNNINYVENRCTKMEYQKIFLKKVQAFPVLINR